MPALTTATANYLRQHAPPAIQSDIGWDLARQFASCMKRDLNLKETYEALGILRIWNGMHGSPFTNEQLANLAAEQPAPATTRRKKGTSDDHKSLFDQD